jgi:hypothetical protein
MGRGNPDLAARIQSSLHDGGFYSNNTYQPTYGLIKQEDIDAFAAAAKSSSQNDVPLSQFLKQSADFAKLNGVTAALSNMKNQKVQGIAQKDPGLLGSMIDAQYKAILGHLPSPSERAGFVAAYNAVYAQQQKDDIAAASAAEAPSALTPEQQTAADFYADTDAGAKARQDVALGPQPIKQPFNMGADSRVTALTNLSPMTTQTNPGEAPSADVLADTINTPMALKHDTLDPTSFAANYARNQHPDQAGAHDVVGQFSNFLSLLGGIKG